MPTDNVTANAGSGGATFRTLADASGNEWPTSVVCYATTVSPGANVLVPVTPANALPIVLTAGSAVIGHVITDSGSVTAATQSGAWNITNISGTISLPTNAAQETGGNLATIVTNTTGLNSAVGTAGSAIPSKGLIVQGSDGTNARALSTTTAGVIKVDISATTANATAVKVDGSAVTQPISGTVTANAGTNLNTSALALETGGNLATTATNTTGLNNTVGTAGSAIPSKGLVVQGSDGTNARALSTTTAGVVKVDISATTANGTAVKVDGSAVTQPVSGAVNIAAAATGGCSMFTMVSAASNNSTQVKASAGTIKAIVVVNTTATIYYLKIFDGSPTMGTTSANWNIPIPANTSAAGVAIPLPPEGLGCSSTINIALTGGLSLTDNTNAATGVAVNIGYK